MYTRTRTHRYTLGIVVVFSSTLKRREHSSHSAHHLYYFFVAVNSFYSFYWDVVMDWGLLDRDCNTGKLTIRKQLLFPRWSYACAAFIDFVLRISWSAKLVSTRLKGESSLVWALGLELARRTMWACIRVEYESYLQKIAIKRAVDLDLLP